MASPCPNMHCCYSASIPKIPSKAPFLWSSSYPSNVYGSYGISLHRAVTNSRTCAKFDKFQGEYPQEGIDEAMIPSPPSSSTSIESEDSEQPPIQGGEEEDDRWAIVCLILWLGLNFLILGTGWLEKCLLKTKKRLDMHIQFTCKLLGLSPRLICRLKKMGLAVLGLIVPGKI